ncbi:MAG: hypothetical protein ACRD4S_16335 [Candidatus Acidiferrales bacterium]
MAISVAFLFKDSIVPPAFLLGRLFFPETVADASDAKLTDELPTGRYRIREGHLPRFGFAISRASTADFVVKAVTNQSTIGKITGVCN